MHYHSLLNECPFAQYKLIVENPDLSPGTCVRILLRVNKDVLCTVFDIHLQPYMHNVIHHCSLTLLNAILKLHLA